MQDIYFNPFSANVTIPASFMEVRTDDDVHIFEDLYTGMIMEISFTELDEDAVYDNLNTVFNVQAEDGNVLYGEYYIKWHNDSGAWIGAVGARCACLIAIANSDAYPVFSNCWDSFAINFSDGETYDLPSDAVSEEVSELLEEQITSEGEDADASKENRTEAVTNEEASDEAVTDTADGDVTGEDRTEDDITDEDATDEDATDEDPAEDESDDTSEETKKNADEIGDYDSPYELMLMDAGDTYESLPFGKDSRISMDTVSYGQITVISYSLDTEDWESCKNDLYELLEEDFETVYSNEYSNDYLSGFQAYMTGYEAGNCADVELYFDIDSLQELKLMFYDKSGSTQPLKGKIMYSDSVLAEYESLGDLSGYEDFMTEMDNTMTELYNIYSEEEMMDRYMQVDYHTFSDTFYANADEWTLTYEIPSDLDSERMLEVGTYEGGSFHMQGMYYVSEIGNVYYMDDQTLYTVNDDGELNEAGPEEEY